MSRNLSGDNVLELDAMILSNSTCTSVKRKFVIGDYVKAAEQLSFCQKIIHVGTVGEIIGFSTGKDITLTKKIKVRWRGMKRIQLVTAWSLQQMSPLEQLATAEE